MDKYFESTEITQIVSLWKRFLQFNELLSCKLFHWTIIFTNLERETWVNVDKNLRTWHRCSLWSHCVQCVVHCALWLGVSWGENTECYELYTGNWRPAKSRTNSQLLFPGRVNVSDIDKVLGILSFPAAAAQCPGQPSLRAKSENVKLNDKIDRLLCAQTTHRYTQMLCKWWKNIKKRSHILGRPF